MSDLNVYLTLVPELCSIVINIPASYSRGPRYEFQPGDWYPD
jgi:hypothetical protein